MCVVILTALLYYLIFMVSFMVSVNALMLGKQVCLLHKASFFIKCPSYSNSFFFSFSFFYASSIPDATMQVS